MDGSADAGLVSAVRAALADAADPAKAGPMQAYMKSDLPFRGVPTPLRRRLSRAVFAAHPLTERSAWDATVRELWDAAAYREERYVAIELTGHRQASDWQDPSTLPLYEHLIVTGAWWDYVDDLAIRRVGPILRAYPAEAVPLLAVWAHDENRWRRRTAVIAQVGSKEATDTDLLAAAIGANLDERDFFLRKGIGWALREHAKTDPDWVRAFVRTYESRLSPLSRREALKHSGAEVARRRVVADLDSALDEVASDGSA